MANKKSARPKDASKPSGSARHCQVADLTPDIVAEVDPDKRYKWINKAGLEFFGEEVVGQEAAAFFVDEQETYAKVKMLFRGDADFIYVESWQRRQDGQKRLLAWWCSPLKDEQGIVQGAVSVGRDITDNIDTEKKLQQSEAQLYNALTLAHLGPWEYDVINDLFTFNDSFYAVFKTSGKEMGGYMMSSADYAKRFVHPDDAEMVGQEVKRVIEAADPNFSRELTHRIKYADGTTGHITVRFFIIKDEDGKTVKTYGINQDITDQTIKEESMEKMRDELQAKVNELERFNKLIVDREIKMVEMKHRIKELEGQISNSKTK